MKKTEKVWKLAELNGGDIFHLAGETKQQRIYWLLTMDKQKDGCHIVAALDDGCTAAFEPETEVVPVNKEEFYAK